MIELIFDAGVLKQEIDRSEPMAEMRERVIQSQNQRFSCEMPTQDEIRHFVERAFDRRYQL